MMTAAPRLKNIHPGEVLKEEFMEPLHIKSYSLAKAIGVPTTRIDAIVKEQRSISADTAIRLGRYFNTTPDFWLGLQNDYDKEELLLKDKAAYDQIVPNASIEQELRAA